MTNTYIAPGDADPEDIIGDVKHGVFAVSFAGGQVEPAPGIDQGFAVRIRSGNRIIEGTLDGEGFPRVRFNGEYPLGRVAYTDPAVPVTVDLEAFSPFIPLNAVDSSLPATVCSRTSTASWSSRRRK